jgi:hypothetical protein
MLSNGGHLSSRMSVCNPRKKGTINNRYLVFMSFYKSDELRLRTSFVVCYVMKVGSNLKMRICKFASQKKVFTF